MLSVKEIVLKLLNAQVPKSITIKRVENSYVNAEAFGRINCVKVGNIGVVRFNLRPSASIPAGQSNFFQIGTISPAPLWEELTCIPSQNGNGSVLTVQITSAGAINLINNSSVATGQNFFRAAIPLSFRD